MMNEIIKERLALIQSGTIPHGYKKTKAGIMPEDWDGTVRAKDVFKNHTDKKHNGDLEILAATQENGIVPRSQIGIDIQCSEEGVNGYKKVSEGDFVISLRSFQGGIEYSEYDGIVSPAYTVLQPIREISDGYYRNYFKTDSFIQRLNGAVYGIRDGKQIGYQDFGDMYIHYPPVEEQKKIAEILAQCDKAIGLKGERLEEEKKKKQWLIETLFNAGTAMELSQCCINSGEYGINAPACPYDPNLPRYIRITDINDSGKYQGDNPVSVKSQDAERYTLQEGDLLFVRTGGTVGKAYRYLPQDGKLVYAGFLIKFSVNQKLFDPRFIYYQFATSRYRNWVSTMSTRSGQPGINANEYGKYLLSIPESITKQKRIADILEEEDRLIDCLSQEINQWKAKKAALSQLLLTGIVRVKP